MKTIKIIFLIIFLTLSYLIYQSLDFIYHCNEVKAKSVQIKEKNLILWNKYVFSYNNKNFIISQHDFFVEPKFNKEYDFIYNTKRDKLYSAGAVTESWIGISLLLISNIGILLFLILAGKKKKNAVKSKNIETVSAKEIES